MLTYYFEPTVPQDFLALLRSAAQKLGVELVACADLTERGADLHFLSAQTSWSGKTGLRVAFGPGWGEAEVAQHNINAWIREDVNQQLAHILVSWALERRELRQLRPLRHELGNLIVIFLARIAKLKGTTDAENIERLENLQQRFDTLYRRVEAIKIP